MQEVSRRLAPVGAGGGGGGISLNVLRQQP